MAAAFLQALARAQGVDDLDVQNEIVDKALAEQSDPSAIVEQVIAEAIEAATEPPA